MRFIDTSRCPLPAGWNQRAQDAERECLGAADAEARRAIWARRSDVWSDLKPTLAGLSLDKCWYCESLNGRADNNVDHFRPKGRVAECPQHPGYWWIAFQWNNYRFSCTFCNSRRITTDTSGGKQDRFPLHDEAARVQAPGIPLGREDPVLLDPTRAADPPLLWFESDGRAVPRHTEAQAQRQHRRAAVSIEHYHLNLPATQEARQQVALRIEALVRECDDLFMQDRDRHADRTLDARFEELQAHLRSAAPFSAAARAVLRNYRYREWVETVFNTL